MTTQPTQMTLQQVKEQFTPAQFEEMVKQGLISIREQQSTRVLTIEEVMATKAQADKRRAIVNKCKAVIQKQFEEKLGLLNDKVQYDKSYKSWTYTEDMDKLVKTTQAKLDKLKIGGNYYLKSASVLSSWI